MTSLTDKISNYGSLLTHNPTSFRFLNTRTFVTICQLILVIFLARQLALITWQILPDNNRDAAGPVFSRSLSSIQQRIQKEGPHSDPLAQLDSLHLFGQPPKAQQIAAPVPEAVPVSRLAVKITGLVASTIPEQSLAIIRSGSTDSTYRPGDTLKGTQARIERIYPDRVIIRNGVRFESLLMYPDEAQKKTHTIVSAPQQQKVRVSNDLRKRLQEKPSSWTDIVSISPVRENGELQGYRINPSRDPKQFEQLGLKPNDMAVAINGYDLTNTREALKIISQLSNPKVTLDQVSLTIERDGQRFEVDLSS